MASAQTLPPPPPPSFSFQPPPLPMPVMARTGTIVREGWNPLSMQRVSLYVGDLDSDVTENELFELFSAVVPVASFRICRCLGTGKSLCYGYVNFFCHSHASKALACLNHTELKGKPIRIMWSHRDPFPRKSGVANLFVKNLDPSVDCARLERIFSPFGRILSCKIVQENGKSKGFGFVQFNSEESAKSAMAALHDTVLEKKKLYVSKFVKKSDRTAAAEEEKLTNLYVKNLPDDMTDVQLEEMFSRYGKVCSVAVMKDGKGCSRGFGFVNFQSPDDAKKALEAMNGVQLGSKNLFVGRAQKKAERTELLKHKYKDMFNFHIEKLKASNLYIKNLNVLVDDQKLQQLFGQYGKITSAKVMRRDNGTSKGFGFVCFATPEEAMAALQGLNGVFFEGKNLYVSVAKRKEERVMELQNYYMQNIPVQSRRFYFNRYHYPPLFPVLHQPSFYQHFVTNMGSQCLFAAKNDQQNISSDYMRYMQPINAGNKGDWIYGQNSIAYISSNAPIQELDHSSSRSKKVVFKKKGNRKWEPAENSSCSNGNYQPVTSATFAAGKSRKNLFVDNLQPERTAKVTPLLEMNSDAPKLLKAPNSLGVQEKSIKVLKEENAKSNEMVLHFSNSKSAHCLSY